MSNLTRREILKVGSTAAATAILNPLLSSSESQKEGNHVEDPESVQTSTEEICSWTRPFSSTCCERKNFLRLR